MRPSAAFDLLIKQGGRGVFAFANRAGTSGDPSNAPTYRLASTIVSAAS